MAGKSVKKARIDVSSSRDVNGAISPPSAATGGADHRNTTGIDENVVSRLRLELEAATKCIEQLRREKDYEVRQVREEEQNRSSTALKELECRLKTECRHEVDRAREVVKSRLEADTARLVGRYERTVKRLSGDLDRCRNELREEVEKRGMSSTTRGGFETERYRLLAEVRDLKAAKRRLEETVESYAEVDKQKTAELKRTQEACKAEVAKLSKEANAEIRKLLEELKAKDFQLALLDRNQYSDRGTSLQKNQAVENQSKENEATASKPVKPASTGEVVDSNANNIITDTISNLKKDVEKLETQLAASKADNEAMICRLDELRCKLTQRNETIARLEKANSNGQVSKQKNPPKAVRFLLPGFTSPVLAREVETTYLSDDDTESVSSEMSCSSLSSASSVMSQDTTVLYDENIVKNYHQLLSEHLGLQRSIALLLSSWAVTSTISSSQVTSEAKSTEESSSTCSRHECIAEKESMKVAMETMEEKHAQYEQNVYQLQQRVREQQDQNEDLEFRVFELEEFAEKCKLTHSNSAADQLLEKIHFLENELSALKERLAYYKAVEDEIIQSADLGLREYIDLIRHQLNDAESQSVMSRLEVLALRKQLKEAVRCQLGVGETKNHLADDELSTADTSAIVIDVDDLSMGAMNSSVSTTSGFDDDNSCASSVADLRLDEMPSEETWGFDEEDGCVNADAELSANLRVVEEKAETDVGKVRQLNRCNERSGSKTEIAAQSNRPNYQQPNGGGDILRADAVRKSDEELWMSRIEKVEARLAQAIENEQRARDQAALLGEEKDRRIAALQEQVDLLEANEFRLSETIRSLERLERLLSARAVGGFEGRTVSPSSSLSTLCSGTADGAVIVAGDEDERDKAVDDAVVVSPMEADDCFRECTDAAAKATMRDDDAAVDDSRIRQEASAMVKASVEKLRQTELESEAVDRRIRELGDAAEGAVAADVIDSSEAAAVDVDNDWTVPAEVVDFEAEYRELEILIKELKRVLTVENRVGKWTADARDQVENVSCVTDNVESVDEVEASGNWDSGSICCSLPETPVFEIQSPMTSLMLERNREFELTERHLMQQIKSLEQERDTLREAVSDGEAALNELSIQLVELQSSERSLKDEVNRLRAKEDWMISRNNELMELVGRLEDSVRNHRAAEAELRSRCERHCASETELGRDLDNARDELRTVENRCRRWVAQLDDEKIQLRSVVDELMEKNSDLEGRESGLMCRIKKLEGAEFGLRSEVAELERSLNEVTDERDRLLMQANDREQNEGTLSALSSIDGWTQCDDVDTGNDHEERCRQLTDRAEFFKEMLEFTEHSYTVLEAQVAEFNATEAILQSTIAEHEKNERVSADRIASLEADKERMTTTIGQLETTVENLKTQYDRQYDEFQKYKGQYDGHLASDDRFITDSEFRELKQLATSAFNGIMLLNEVADELDDTEVALWASVENAPLGGDGITDTELTSSVWSDVESRMGLNTVVDSPSTLDDNKRANWPSLNVDLQSSNKCVSNEKQSTQNPPPPLPLSPPPSSPDRDVEMSYGRPAHKPRSQSAIPFSAASPGEQPWKRANSESWDVIVDPKLPTFNAPTAGHESLQTQQNTSFGPCSDTAVAAVRDPVIERITKSREFWSARSLSMPGHQAPPPDSYQGQGQGHSASNGRPSLIPRIALPLRTPPVQRSISEYGGPKAGVLPMASTTMPVIRSTPSAHLSPRSSTTELEDKKNNKSFIPRPINDYWNLGSDSENSDHSSSAKPIACHGRSGNREHSKIYTTVMGPNRYVTSKFSHLTGSSISPHAVRTNVTDRKTNPSTASISSATATNQLQRPVVSSTANGSEVTQLPGSRA